MKKVWFFVLFVSLVLTTSWSHGFSYKPTTGLGNGLSRQEVSPRNDGRGNISPPLDPSTDVSFLRIMALSKCLDQCEKVKAGPDVSPCKKWCFEKYQ